MVVALNIYRCGSGGEGGPAYMYVLGQHKRMHMVSYHRILDNYWHVYSQESMYIIHANKMFLKIARHHFGFLKVDEYVNLSEFQCSDQVGTPDM